MKLPNSETKEEDESDSDGMVAMKRHYVLVLMVVFLVIGLMAGTASGVLMGLTGHWSASLVAALQAKGIVSGDATGDFAPDAPLTRGQLAKLFAVGLGFEQEAQLLSRYPSRYRDVPDSHWAKGYIESLAEIGLTDGYPDGRFGPDDPVSRAQLAVMSVRASGLSDQARAVRFERSAYGDDREIASWARGEVIVGTEKGLVTGFTDNTFRPLRPVTRAEGSAVLLRLLNFRGTAYHLSGILVRFDAASRTGVVRDVLGQDRSFIMAEEAEFYRGGRPVSQYAIRPPDQVWVVLGDDGVGRFMEARYKDLLAQQIRISGTDAVVSLEDGSLKVVPVQSNASVFLNGRSVPLQEISGTGPAYLVLDVTSGLARIIDAIHAPIIGEFIGARGNEAPIVILVDDQSVEYELASDIRIFLNGESVAINQVAPGDQVRLAVDAAGRVTYLQAER